MPLQYHKPTKDLAVTAATLIQLSPRAHEKFGLVWEELIVNLALGNYIFQHENNVPVAFMSWQRMSNVIFANYTNNLRPLHRSECNTGFIFLINFFSASLGYPVDLLDKFYKDVLSNDKERNNIYVRTATGVHKLEPPFENAKGVLF